MSSAAKEVYDRFNEPIRRAALSCGYVIGVHGSLEHDIDLLAVPWVEGAVSPDALCMVIACVVDGYCNYRAVENPYARLDFVIHLGGGLWIDLSVMPRWEKSRSGTKG